MTPADIFVQSEERGLYFLISVSGHFDGSVIPQIREAVENAVQVGHTHLAIDLGKATFINSTGIGTLVNILKKMKSKGGGLYLVAVPKIIRDSLSATQIIRVIPFYESLQKADEDIGT